MPRVLPLNHTRDHTDNAVYHHCHGILSLPALKKKTDLFDLIKEVGLTELTLRPTTEVRAPKRPAPVKIDTNDETRYHICSTTSKTKKDVPTVEELRFEFAEALRLHKDEDMRILLDCKIESLLSQRGDDWLWTPPYTPTIQPIEIFGGSVRITPHADMRTYAL